MINPRGTVPTSLVHAKELLRLSTVDNTTYKAMLKNLKVTGAHNPKLSTKAAVLAAKMTQRQFSVTDALKLVEIMEGENSEEPHFLKDLSPTAVRINKLAWVESLLWLRGDIQIMEGDEIKVGEPVQEPLTFGATQTSREPDFLASEFCLILQTLAEMRMTAAKSQLMEPKIRDELDREPSDPWSEHIPPLYNDESFQPSCVTTLAGGVTRADIDCIDPSKRPHQREAGVLKRKIAKFKSAYGTALSKYEASDQGPDCFVFFTNGKAYLMYTFFFLKQHPLIQPLSTRALQTDVQKEEGVGEGVSPKTPNGYGYGHKRKREKQEINIVGVDSLSSAFRPFSEEVAKATEEAERDKAQYEAAEAKERSAQSLLSAIAQAKEMLQSATRTNERNLYVGLIDTLMSNLSKNQ